MQTIGFGKSRMNVMAARYRMPFDTTPIMSSAA